MTRMKQYIVQVFFAVTLLTSCSGNATSVPTPIEGNSFTNVLLPLDSMFAKFAEIIILNPTWQSGPVWAVQYLIKTNNVMGVYGDDGHAVKWSIDTANIDDTYELKVTGPKATQFSADGNLLIGPTGHIFKTNEITNHSVEYIVGIAAWDMKTGELIKCLSLPCYKPPSEITEGDIGAIVDQTGKWIFIYDESSVSILDLFGDTPSQGILVNSSESDYWWNIGRIAYDQVNQRYAIIYQEGRVEVRKLDPKNIGSFSFSTILAEGKENEFSDVPAAMFDATGKWLAYVRANQLIIWKTDQHSGQMFFNKEIHNILSLNFDRTGKLLLVALKDKIAVLDVAQKKVVAEYSTPNITSFDISQDNRLLIWGDNLGAIHIWGVRK
jgi:hypothetical protein